MSDGPESDGGNLSVQATTEAANDGNGQGRYMIPALILDGIVCLLFLSLAAGALVMPTSSRTE